MLIIHHAGHIAVLTTHTHTHTHTIFPKDQPAYFRSQETFTTSPTSPYLFLPIFLPPPPGIFPRLPYGDTGLSLKFVFRPMRVLTLSGFKAKLPIHKVPHHLAPTFTHTLASLMSLTIVFLLLPLQELWYSLSGLIFL